MAGSYKGRALGQLFQQKRNIRLFHHFQKFVRGIVLQAADHTSRIIEGDSLFFQKRHNTGLVEALFTGYQKMVLVTEKKQTDDAPHIVLQIRIKEIHAPALTLRRKTSQHQQTGLRRQEGFQGMCLYGRKDELFVHDVVGFLVKSYSFGLGSFLANRTMLYTYSVIQFSE